MIRQGARVIRAEIRAGRLSGPTSGMAAGFVQANIAVLPQPYADGFAAFCAANARACPLLLRSEPGEFTLPALGEGVDIRTDLPRYWIHRRGRPVEEVLDIRDHWRGDLVTFVLGCSNSFEEALLTAGLEIRNITEGRSPPVYHTNRPCAPAGGFSAELVASMRPFAAARLDRVDRITARYPLAHGAPVFAGDPAGLGIGNLDQPDFGEAVSVREGEVPVFWPCGVTAMEALRNAGVEFCITHSPGHMLICDRLTSELENIGSCEELDWFR